MDYQGNSKKQNQADKLPTEKKKVEQVVTGEVISRPKPLGRRFKDIFVSADFKGVVRYVGAEVVLPAVRNLIVDAGTKGIERMMYGESVSRRRHISTGPRITYNNPINRTPEPRRRVIETTARSRHSREDIILSSRDEAETVLERLIDIIDSYDAASVGDLNELLGLPTSHVDNKWGWSDLVGADVRQVREGYLLNLPPAEPI